MPIKLFKPLVVKQKEIYIDKNVDYSKLFEFTKMLIKDMFREMKEKGNENNQIRIDIKLKEV